MPSFFARRFVGIISSVAVMGLVAACMQPQPAPSAPPPSAPPPAAAVPVPPSVPTVTVVKRAHFRDGPSLHAPIIGMIPAGTPVILVGPPGGKWVQVSFQNRVGYVYGRLVK
jgi:hypothetical protein